MVQDVHQQLPIRERSFRRNSFHLLRIFPAGTRALNWGAVIFRRVSGAYAGSVAAAEETETGDSDGGEGRNWGRVLDGAGAVAGVVLAIIVVDVWTDGRLISRRLTRRGDGADPEPEEQPAGE